MDLRPLRLYQLDKQGLSVKAPRREYRRLFREHLGLHSTDYLTPYLSLWARVEDFEPRALLDDLNASRTAVRVRAFRGTVFVVHRRNLGLVLGGLRPYHESVQAQIARLGAKTGQDFGRMQKRVVSLLRGRKLLPSAAINRDLRATVKGEVSPFFLRYLEFGGVLVRVGQDHAEDRTSPYGLLEEWFPEVSLKDVDPERAREELALAYIRRFGPVSIDDLSWWLPAPKTASRRIVGALGDRLASIDFDGRDYFLAREEAARLKSFSAPGDGPLVHFLPYEDHYPKAFARRSWFLAPEAEKLLFSRKVTELGQIRPSIWLDGEAVGRWEIERPARGSRLPAKVVVAGLVKSARGSRAVRELVEERRRAVEDFLNRRLLPLGEAEEET